MSTSRAQVSVEVTYGPPVRLTILDNMKIVGLRVLKSRDKALLYSQM